MDQLQQALDTLSSITAFTEKSNGIKLRRYQQAAAEAIVDSVQNMRGLTFVVMFPRQSGKNELQAQIESFILTVRSRIGAEIIKVSPTWKPQSSKRHAPVRESLKPLPGRLPLLGKRRGLYLPHG